MGCKGPTTYNACSTMRWNEGTSFPIGSGHGCIGCSEDGFWDKGSFYERLTTIREFGVEANADKVGRRRRRPGRRRPSPRTPPSRRSGARADRTKTEVDSSKHVEH